VPRAKAARVSMIRFSQSSWTAENGDSPRYIGATKTTNKQERLTVT
jgi:hypothetical protein